MPSKRDTLLTGLAGSGSVSDRLYAQEKAAYSGPNPGTPRSLNDLLVANGNSKKQIQ